MFFHILGGVEDNTIDKHFIICYNVLSKSLSAIFYYIYIIPIGRSAAARFINLYNIEKGNPEDGISRKGNALQEDKYVT